MRTRTNSPRRSALALAVTAALLVSACGSDDDAADAPAATDPVDEPAATDPVDEPADTQAEAPADEPADTQAEAPADEPAVDGPLGDRDSISFGALWETPPTIAVDPDDTTVPVGVSPDLAAAMGAMLGVEVEWQNMQWPAQLPGVQSGVVDALFGQVTITEERELSIVDLIPFLRSTWSLLLPEGNPEGITMLADACGLSIGVPVGSTQTALLEQINADACVPNGEDPIVPAEYQGATAAISAIQAGTIDGWLDSTGPVNEAAASGVGAFTTAEVPDSEHEAQFTGIAVGKDQPEVSLALVDALRSLIEDGTYAAIMEEWGMSDALVSVDDVVINPISGTPAGEVAAG